LREVRQADPALDVAAFAVDAFEFAKMQKIARIIGTVLCCFHRHLVILSSGTPAVELPFSAPQHHDTCDHGRDLRRDGSLNYVVPAPLARCG